MDAEETENVSKSNGENIINNVSIGENGIGNGVMKLSALARALSCSVAYNLKSWRLS